MAEDGSLVIPDNIVEQFVDYAKDERDRIEQTRIDVEYVKESMSQYSPYPNAEDTLVTARLTNFLEAAPGDTMLCLSPAIASPEKTMDENKKPKNKKLRAAPFRFFILLPSFFMFAKQNRPQWLGVAGPVVFLRMLHIPFVFR